MSKIVCDICGTTYSDMEDYCPNCGCSQDVSADIEMEFSEEEDFLQDSPIMVRRQKDAPEEEPAPLPDTPEEAAEEEEEEEPRETRTFVVILLTVIIMLLLAAAGFLFLRYMLPNLELGKPQTSNPGIQQTEAPVETTVPGIPCRKLVLVSGGVMEMTREGEYKLIHVMAKPEDTTDTITYVSSDEAVVTVNEEGRLTAVSEGEAVVTIVCGDQKVECRVKIAYVEETVPPTEAETEPAEETEPEETAAQEQTPDETEETQAVEETEPAETEAAVQQTQEQLKDVTLKLGKSEFILPPGYTYTVPLDCDLKYEEIEWSMEHPYIASVKNGVVSGLSTGVTVLTAKYGDQTVTCIVRIKKI